MKKIFLLYVMLLGGISLFAAGCNWNSIDRIVILYSDWDLLTDIPISGPDFHHIAKQEFTITETDVISAFKNEMGKLCPIEDTNINVRCKVLFYSGSHIEETFCITNRSVLNRGYTYEFSQELFSLINGIISTYCYIEPSTEEFPIYSNQAIVPPDLLTPKLFQHIDKRGIPRSTKAHEIIAICKVDIFGNTVDASLFYNPELENDYMKEYIKLFIIENLKWRENPERSLSDKYYYSILFDSNALPEL